MTALITASSVTNGPDAPTAPPDTKPAAPKRTEPAPSKPTRRTVPQKPIPAIPKPDTPGGPPPDLPGVCPINEHVGAACLDLTALDAALPASFRRGVSSETKEI